MTGDLTENEIKKELDGIKQEVEIFTDQIDNSDTETVPYIGSDNETIRHADSDDVDFDSDTETIQYADPYRYISSKKDELYRRKAKKKTIKILNKKRQIFKKKRNDKSVRFADQDDLSEAKTIPYVDDIKTEDAEDDVDFEISDSQIVWDGDNKDLVPLEIDDNKIVLTDDGNVVLTEPDNMQVEERSIIPLSEDVVMLPPEEQMDVVRTKNLVLKRKQKK